MRRRSSTFACLAGQGDKAGKLSIAVGGVEPVLLQGRLGHGRGGWQPRVALVSGSGGVASTRALEHYLVIELGILCYSRTCSGREHQDVSVCRGKKGSNDHQLRESRAIINIIKNYHNKNPHYLWQLLLVSFLPKLLPGPFASSQPWPGCKSLRGPCSSCAAAGWPS